MQRSVAKFLLTSLAKARGSCKHYQTQGGTRKHHQPGSRQTSLQGRTSSTNKLFSAGLQPGDLRQLILQMGETRALLEAGNSDPGCRSPSPPARAIQALNHWSALCAQVGMCLLMEGTACFLSWSERSLWQKQGGHSLLFANSQLFLCKQILTWAQNQQDACFVQQALQIKFGITEAICAASEREETCRGSCPNGISPCCSLTAVLAQSCSLFLQKVLIFQCFPY